MYGVILLAGISASDRAEVLRALEGCDVIESGDCTDTLSCLDRHQNIDLILLDSEHIDAGGTRILDAMHAGGWLHRTHTLLLTSAEDPATESLGLRWGAADYLRRPLMAESLRTRIGLHLDFLVRQKSDKELHERTLIFDTVFQQAPIGIAISYGNRLIAVNPMYTQITGRSSEELFRIGWEAVTHPDDIEREMALFEQLRDGYIRRYTLEKRMIRPDDSDVWVSMVVSVLQLDDTDNFNHICLLQDITEEKAVQDSLSESERSKSVLLSHLPGMAYRCRYEPAWTMEYVSAGILELTGYRSKSLLYNRELAFNDLIAPEYREGLWAEWTRVLAERQPFRYEYEILTADGQRKWVLELGQGIYDEQGVPEALEGIILDISDRKTVEQELVYGNEHDTWTGLYNRRHLVNLLRQDAKRSPDSKRALLSVDLSRMHSFSMSFGYQYAQDLIRKIAQTLSLLCQDKGQLFYISENKYAIYVRTYDATSDLIGLCESVSGGLVSLIASENVTGGIGILEIDAGNRSDADELIKNLLIASERALEIQDRDFGCCFFDGAMQQQIRREELIQQELSQVAAGEYPERLYVQYQPVLDLPSGRICGFEALARFHSDTLGPVTPLEFIPIAEKTQLILPLGERILADALAFIKKLNDQTETDLMVSVNISVLQVMRTGFIARMIEAVRVAGVEPGNVCVELTESVIAKNYQEINQSLASLRQFGISVAVDDFGTGYSSLALVRDLNVDCLKIDKHFVDGLLVLEDDQAITGDIISMGHRLGYSVVAEGVEQASQLHYLKQHGCDKIQGYLISRPLDEADAIRRVVEERRA